MYKSVSGLNLKWDLQKMDMIAHLSAKGWRPDELAFEYGASEQEMVELLQRNGLPVHPRRKRS